MPWNPIDPAIPGEVISAAYWNEQVSDNLTHLRTSGLALPNQTANCLIQGGGPDTFFATQPSPKQGIHWDQTGALTYWPSVAMHGAVIGLNYFVYGYGATGEYTLNQMVPTAGYVPRFNVAGSAWENCRVVGRHELFIPASAMRPRTLENMACGWHEVINLTANSNLLVMPFPHTQAFAECMGWMALPKAWDQTTNLGFQIFGATKTISGFVTYTIYIDSAGHGEALGTWGSNMLNFGTFGPGVLTVSPEQTIAIGKPGDNKIVHFLLRRQYGAYGDTLADTFYLAGVKFYLVTNQTTDD